MTECHHRHRNRAILRNLIALAPIAESKTRWSGKVLKLERFGCIYDALRKVSKDDHSTVAMDLSYQFKADVQRYEKQLRQINQVTGHFQRNQLSFSDC